MADIRRAIGTGIRVRPIGVARSPFKEPSDLPPPAFAPPRFFAAAKGEIEVRPEFEAGLEGLERYSHIIVLFHFHKAGAAKLEVVPPGQSRPRGVFASRSPHRP
ncbi:MAG: SAM-dependent methyltransferase, partial [Candidatus Aminicenantes bacterium]|nr:SAM-dependent methyltransferase [Candidatus Aminicenantes bacterium]